MNNRPIDYDKVIRRAKALEEMRTATPMQLFACAEVAQLAGVPSEEVWLALTFQPFVNDKEQWDWNTEHFAAAVANSGIFSGSVRFQRRALRSGVQRCRAQATLRDGNKVSTHWITLSNAATPDRVSRHPLLSIDPDACLRDYALRALVDLAAPGFMHIPLEFQSRFLTH
jgi:hypothetical protein